MSASAVRGSISIMSVLLALLILLAVPLQARASDPLLSGYAGPGGGEQTLLGGGTVGGSKGGPGGGASGATSLRAVAQAQAAPVTAVPATPSSDTSGKPKRKKSASHPSSPKQHMSTGSGTEQATAPAEPAGAPRVVAYPTHAGQVSGLPLSLPGALLAVAALALLVLAGLVLRRFASSTRSPSSPQVSLR